MFLTVSFFVGGSVIKFSVGFVIHQAKVRKNFENHTQLVFESQNNILKGVGKYYNYPRQIANPPELGCRINREDAYKLMRIFL